MQKKRYDGYKSFQYLDPGEYPSVELVAEIDRVPSNRVPTTEAQEARVRRIFADHLAISLHDHWQSGLWQTCTILRGNGSGPVSRACQHTPKRARDYGIPKSDSPFWAHD